MSVKDLNPLYKQFIIMWTRIRDCVAGQDAVQAKGEVYLPRLKDQTPDDYQAYVNRATFYNASGRTISGLNGMLHRKPPQMTVPGALDDDLNDVDMQGTPFQILVKEVTNEVLEVGRVGILIDFPKMVESEQPVTIALAQSLGLRPTIQFYPTENIINWKTRRINNATVLSMVVLCEIQNITKDEFNDNIQTNYRVLDLDGEGLYRVRVFTIDEKGNDLLLSSVNPLMDGKRLNYIPFIFIGPDDVCYDIEEPPLLDLVNVNMAHYRVTADYEHGCHFTGLPTAVITGYTPGKNEAGVVTEKFYIGSATAWTFPDPQAKAEYLEFTGQGLGALERNLDRKESQMAILGARMIAAEKKQAETATTSAIHRTGENSVLSSIAISVSLAMTRALNIFAEWKGVASECVFQLNREFMPVTVDPVMFQGWLKALQAGAISYDTFFDWIQRGDMIDAELTPEDEQTEIEADGDKFKAAPPAPTPGPNGPPNPNSPQPPPKAT